MKEYISSASDLEFGLKRLERQRIKSGFYPTLARLREPSQGERKRQKHTRHLRQVSKGKRMF